MIDTNLIWAFVVILAFIYGFRSGCNSVKHQFRESRKIFNRFSDFILDKLDSLEYDEITPGENPNSGDKPPRRER